MWVRVLSQLFLGPFFLMRKFPLGNWFPLLHQNHPSDRVKTGFCIASSQGSQTGQRNEADCEKKGGENHTKVIWTDSSGSIVYSTAEIDTATVSSIV